MVVNIHSIKVTFFRKGRISCLLILAMLGLSNAVLHAQVSPFDSVWTSDAAKILEEVDCFTDRSLYICEELIHFRAQVSVSGPTGPGPWSTVLYVELVSVDGKRLAWSKYPLQKGISSGELRIPDDILSGHYYLRSYTRWMRNRGPESFSYTPLRIINPHQSEMYQAASTNTGSVLQEVHTDSELNLKFREQVSSFERGDSVVLDLVLSGEQVPDSMSGCFTVVPLSVHPSLSRQSDQISGGHFRMDFLPDRYGPSLSGTVQYPDGGNEGLPPALIHFTLLGDAAGYFMCRSDSNGKFSVGLPVRSGKLEIFVQAEGPDREELEVRIDQDFDPRHIYFRSPPFTMTNQERKQAAIMARNVQLSGIYGYSDTLVAQASASEASTFYGAPTRSVDLDQYVLLPSLREVFLNLVPGVTPKTRRKRSSLLIESINPSLSLYESLVMVDQVPVLDVERFMSLSPAKIKQIDVIEDVYVKGDLRFGGVINMRTMDGDMAGIDLPENSFFIDYLALQPAFKSHQDALTAEDQMPDLRNTFFWEPDFILQKGSNAGISFIAPDYPGEYMVLFRGRSDKGEPVVAESTFKVN